MKNKTIENGFSTIELIMTLFIAAAFVAVFYQLFILINGLSSDGYQKSLASNLAYANMRMYATTNSPTWLTCNSATDLKTYPSGTGQILLSGNITVALPPPTTQSVIATAPYGCSGSNIGMPIKVESSITYGPQSKKVTHTTYVGY